MYEQGHQAHYDEPDNGTELRAGQPRQSPSFATETLVSVLLFLVVPQVIGQKPVPLLRCQLCWCTACDILGGQQRCCACLQCTQECCLTWHFEHLRVHWHFLSASESQLLCANQRAFVQPSWEILMSKWCQRAYCKVADDESQRHQLSIQRSFPSAS